jgi:nucleotide-binding universal stress UspA family protein
MFARVLVPYDGSEPSQRALLVGIALARATKSLDVVTIVDEVAVMSESGSVGAAFDPTPIIDALESAGRASLAEAAALAQAAGVEAHTLLLTASPVAGIVTAAERNDDDLIVLGTHGREGIQRAFLGSTTEGVLRSTGIPVITVHGDVPPPANGRFRTVFVAVDDSDPSDAAVVLAAELTRSNGATCLVCHVFDAGDAYETAGLYGYDPSEILTRLRRQALATVDRAIEHGGFPPGAARGIVVDDQADRGIVGEAARQGADIIVVGSHGRRGLRRLFLGSVAEHVVRHSTVPVLVVRSGNTLRGAAHHEQTAAAR